MVEKRGDLQTAPRGGSRPFVPGSDHGWSISGQKGYGTFVAEPTAGLTLSLPSIP
jgi:hypothetical protein